jgi:hypothetical protein
MLRYFYFYIFRYRLFGILFMLVSFLWLFFFDLFFGNSNLLGFYPLIFIFLLLLLASSLLTIFLLRL